MCDIRLPWEHLSNGYGPNQVRTIRAAMTDDEIEDAFPKPFRKLFRYVRSLGYDQKPAYDRIVSYFEDLKKKA